MSFWKQFFTYDTDLPPGLGIQNFSTTHIAYMLAALIFIIAFSFVFRKLRTRAQDCWLRSMTWLLIALESARIIWSMVIGHFDPARMLPLHLCGFMVFFIPMAVFGRMPLMEQFSYCCGVPGAIVALLTPEEAGYPFLHFQTLQSISTHTLIALIPILLVVSGRFRPSMRYMFKCFLVLMGITCVDWLVNHFLGSNYLFISSPPPDTPAALYESWVGRPGYVGLLLLTVVIVWLCMLLPWSFKRAKTNKIPLAR